MKISKSKQELARIISENGGWRDGEFAAQDGDGGVGGYAVKPEWNSLAKYWWRGMLGEWFLANKIKNHHQTVLSSAEYLHLYPAPDADGWIEWLRDEPPVGDGVIIDVKYSDGDELHSAPCGVFTANMTSIRGECASAESFGRGDGSFVHIIAYRLHKPEQSKPEFCESVMRSIPEPSDKPTIEQLAADYRNAKDYAERKQQKADDAKADAEAKLAELVAAGKVQGLVLSVAEFEPELELVITDWRDLRAWDEIEMLGDGWNCDNVGKIGVVIRVEGDGYIGDLAILCDIGEEGSDWGLGFKFIRRP